MDVNTILGNIGPAGTVIIPALVIAGASILDALVPMPTEGSGLWYVKKVVAWLAVNIGHAKNKAS